MKLSSEDADLFFKLMWSLQNFINLRFGILPELTMIDEYHKLPTPKKLAVRNALYDNIEIIDTYLEENPQNFPGDELEIIKSWKQFLRGDFFIERLLKKYAIFIGGDHVYAVLALNDPFEDLLPDPTLPYYVKAVLLPFKGKIIFDGLLEGYPILFGSGIRYDLKETYIKAKQNGNIIESFDRQTKALKPVIRKKPGVDLKPIIDDISEQAKILRSSSYAPAIHGPAFSLVKASIEFSKLAIEDPDDMDGLWKALRKVENAVRRAETALYRSEYD